MALGGTIQISVEEFIPVDQVDTMLAASEKVFRLFKDDQGDAALNLKRSMVWMMKYIAPTSEFWDWPVVEVQVEAGVGLRVTFIGHGWVIALVRNLSRPEGVGLAEAEAQLIELLDRITGHIDVQAVARLKSTPWSPGDVRGVGRYLRKQGYRVRSTPPAGRLTVGDARLSLGSAETVVLPKISRDADSRLRILFGHIKRWANARDRYEGADWCCYKRRRLTVVVTAVRPGCETDAISDDELSFLDLDHGVHMLRDANNYDIVDFTPAAPTSDQRVGALLFPRYGYHLGVIHPRAIVRLVDGAQHEALSTLLDYISYLWVSHYSRIWIYLDFEEQFAYASDIRRVPELDDHALAGYSRRAIRVEELRNRIELMNRIDAGKVNAYVPPHSAFVFSAGGGGKQSTVSLLRSALIPSTVTQLTIDPLREAPTILEHAASELMRSYSVFVQAASLRMQRALQILQVLFIVAAVGQVLTLVPVGDVLDTAVSSELRHARLTAWFDFKASVPWLAATDVSLLTIRVAVLLLGTIATLALLRRRRVVRLLKSRLE